MKNMRDERQILKNVRIMFPNKRIVRLHPLLYEKYTFRGASGVVISRTKIFIIIIYQFLNF